MLDRAQKFFTRDKNLIDKLRKQEKIIEAPICKISKSKVGISN